MSEAGVALQLRVHQYNPFKRQKQTMLGEVLLSIEALAQTTRELFVWMPLHSRQFTGHLGELLHLVRSWTLSRRFTLVLHNCSSCATRRAYLCSNRWDVLGVRAVAC